MEQMELLGQWVSSGWLKAYWTPGIQTLHLTTASVDGGRKIVGTVTSQHEISFDRAVQVIKEVRMNNNLGAVIKGSEIGTVAI